MLLVSFSQSDYYDEKVAKKIAADLRFDFIFHSLDNGCYLKNIEAAVHANDGLVFYAGAAHEQSTLALLNFSTLGLIHTGMVGAPLGSYLYGKEHVRYDEEKIKKFAFSTMLFDKLPDEVQGLLKTYENTELLGFYNRGINGIFNGYRVIEQFSEFASPYMDRDFFEYSMKIPPKFRNGKNILGEWILTCLPEAGRYVHEKTRCKINSGIIRVGFFAAMRILSRKILGPRAGDSMNPTEYWYKTNPDLKETFDSYFNGNISLLSDHPGLLADSTRLYNEGTVLEKTQVLTLLSVMKCILPGKN